MKFQVGDRVKLVASVDEINALARGCCKFIEFKEAAHAD